MKHLAATLLLLVIPLSVWCHQPSTKTVKGCVWDVKEQPISNATIKADTGEESHSLDDGTFSFHVSTQCHFIRISANGYLASDYELDGAFVLIRLRKDPIQSVRAATATPTPTNAVKDNGKTKTLRGRILDENGRPKTDVIIQTDAGDVFSPKEDGSFNTRIRSSSKSITIYAEGYCTIRHEIGRYSIDIQMKRVQ